MKILAFAGALRGGSFNRKLLAVAVGALSGQAEVDLLDLRDVPMPPYDGDIEATGGIPEGARAFRQRIAAAQGLLICSPEYNWSIPGTLKNVIDWASRGDGNPFRGKVAQLMGASPGPYGAVRSALALRQVLCALGVIVLPGTVQISRAGEAFDASGRLVDPKSQTQVDKACAELVRVTRLLTG
jgi:chromate reductase, NAD(P)H dehydrogenase (quinone)